MGVRTLRVSNMKQKEALENIYLVHRRNFGPCIYQLLYMSYSEITDSDTSTFAFILRVKAGFITLQTLLGSAMRTVYKV